MKTKLMKTISLILVLAMCVSTFNITVFAAVVTDFSAPPLYLEQADDEESGTVTVTVKASSAFTYIGGKVTMQYDKAAFTLTSANITSAAGINLTKNLNESSGVVLTLTTEENVDINANDVFLSFVFTKAESIEDGSYTFGLVVDEWTNSNYGVDTFTNPNTNTVTYSVGVPTDGYTATIAGDSNNGTVRVDNTLKVNIGTNKDFAATEMTITYDPGLVSFVKDTDATYTITDDSSNGTLKLADYGEDKSASDANYVLTFKAKADGNAVFKITGAGFGTGVGGTSEYDELTPATVSAEGITIPIAKKQYTVTFEPDGIFSGAEHVLDGEDYTFEPESATGAYYNYSGVKYKIGDVTEWTDLAVDTNGKWTVSNVAGNLTITGTRTAKSYNVITKTVFNNEADTETEENAATYNSTDGYTFTVPENEDNGTEVGYSYTLTAVTIGGTDYSGYSVNGKTYTIPGSHITGEIVITITKERTDPTKIEITVGGDAAGTIVGGGTITVEKEDPNATITLDEDATKGYDITVTVDGTQIEANEDGKYKISGITSETAIVVDKTVNVTDVTNVNGNGDSFVQSDGDVMWLIKMPDNMDNMEEKGGSENKVYTYNGQQMQWSERHGAYVTTVFSAEEPAITADQFEIITVDKTPEIAEFDYDVNKSGEVDANDAQLIWNMYKALYSNFTENVTREKFVLADANADGILNLSDAVVIINDILKITANKTT